MKRLLAILTTVLVLMPETALAKGKVAGSCAQAVGAATVNTFRGSAFIFIIAVVGVWVAGILAASRRKDKELAKFKGEPGSVKTGIFGHP